MLKKNNNLYNVYTLRETTFNSHDCDYFVSPVHISMRECTIICEIAISDDLNTFSTGNAITFAFDFFLSNEFQLFKCLIEKQNKSMDFRSEWKA